MPTKIDVTDAEALGAAMRSAREAAGISREELGRLIDLSSGRIQQYERGWHRVYGKQVVDLVPAPMLEVIAEKLDTTAYDILTAADLAAEDVYPHRPAEMAHTEAAAARRIASAEKRSDRITMRIDTARDSWEGFVRALTPEAKEQFIMLMSNGNVTVEQ